MTSRKAIGALVALFCLSTPFVASAKSKAPKAAKAEKAAKPSVAEATAAKAQDTFPPFCEQWMGKLAVRERDNIAHLEWKASGGGYNGTYVGYPKEHNCTVSNDGKVPIGRVLYKEVTYRQEGATLEEAKASAPTPVEIYEVTELFQFAKGKWSSD